MIGKKRVLVIGAGGYLGSRLCHSLHSFGHEVIGSFLSKPADEKEWGKFISQFIFGDIRNKNTAQQIVSSKAQVIIYLISLNHTDSEKNLDYSIDVNVKPVLNILSSLSNLKSPPQKFIYFSTVQVYGNILHGKIKETQKLKPVNIYGLTHQLAEEICNFFNKNFNCFNIRLSNSYGQPLFLNENCWQLVINNIAKSAFENKKIILHSDGKVFKDFIHFSEICSFINSLIKTNSLRQNTFNLTSSKSISLIDAAIIVQKVYYDKYNFEIPIYLNSNQFFSQKGKEKIFSNFQFVNNDFVKKNTWGINSLSEGVGEIFDYLDHNNTN